MWTQWSDLILSSSSSSSSSSTEHRWLMEDLNDNDNNNNNGLDNDNDDARADMISLISIILSNIFLFFLIFGLSATVQVGNLKHQLTNKFAICTGVTMQFVIMPILGFLAVVLLRSSGYTKPMGMLLLVVTASPGGSYSNWWCSLFNAELALSVAMTSVSSILSIGLLPANLFVYTWLAYTVFGPSNTNDDDNIDIVGVDDSSILQSLDFGAIFISLGIVMAAIILGLLTGYIWDNETFHTRANAFGSVCGLLLILMSMFLSSGSDGSDTSFWSLPWSFYVGTAFPCIVGMTIANILSRSFRLSDPECVAISIECCYQNTAIATSVAVTMFSDPNERAQAISVPLFYGIVEAIIIGVYCIWAWKMGWTKAPKDENICVVMATTYEVVHHHHDTNTNDDDNNTPMNGDDDDDHHDIEGGGKKKQKQRIDTLLPATDKEEEDEDEDRLTARTTASTITTMTGAVSSRGNDNNSFNSSGDIVKKPHDQIGPLPTSTRGPGGGGRGDRDRFYSADGASTGGGTTATDPITPMTPGDHSVETMWTPTPAHNVVRLQLDMDCVGEEEPIQRQAQHRPQEGQNVVVVAKETKSDVVESAPSSTTTTTTTSMNQPPKKQPVKCIVPSKLPFPRPPSGRILDSQEEVVEVVEETAKKHSGGDDDGDGDDVETTTPPASNRNSLSHTSSSPSQKQRAKCIIPSELPPPRPPSGRSVVGTVKQEEVKSNDQTTTNQVMVDKSVGVEESVEVEIEEYEYDDHEQLVVEEVEVEEEIIEEVEFIEEADSSCRGPWDEVVVSA